MKYNLSEQDRQRLDGLIKDTEKRTNSQIVLAMIQRCDSYAEIPWKAFALGAAFTALAIFLADLFLIGWHQQMMVLFVITSILAGGALLALLTLPETRFARMFLSGFRAETEVKQYAESLFLSRELFATQERRGILLLVGIFERQVVILPDSGLTEQLPEATLQNIITTMTPYLKQKDIRMAFETGLEKLSALLTSDVPGDKNELSDEIIEEKGV